MNKHADLLLVALLFLLVACDKQAESARKNALVDTEPVVESSNKTLAGAEVDVPGEWRAYEKAIESQLAELEGRMKSLKMDTQKAGKRAKLELKEAVSELEEMRSKMDTAMKNLEDSYDRAVARFNKPT